MVGYLQIHNKQYLDILNPILSEMVIGTESRYRIALVLFVYSEKNAYPKFKLSIIATKKTAKLDLGRYP